MKMIMIDVNIHVDINFRYLHFNGFDVEIYVRNIHYNWIGEYIQILQIDFDGVDIDLQSFKRSSADLMAFSTAASIFLPARVIYVDVKIPIASRAGGYFFQFRQY